MTARTRWGTFAGATVAIIVVLAFVVSRYASSEPDGLSRVAIDKGFAGNESSHALAASPTAGYEVNGVDDRGLSNGLAGVIGVTVTFALTGGVFVVVRRIRPRPT